MFLVKCPKCGNSMKTDPKGRYIDGKSKRCVYCGRSFQIKDSIVKEC